MPPNQPTPKPPASGNGRTILIAEDDPFISRMYETKLKNAGYSVTVKNNGRDAYEEVKREKPSLILLDLNMPELSGFEVLGALQSDGVDFNDLPVMILTNSSQEHDLQTAKKFGVDYYVKAELTPGDIVERIGAKLSLKPEAK